MSELLQSPQDGILTTEDIFSHLYRTQLGEESAEDMIVRLQCFPNLEETVRFAQECVDKYMTEVEKNSEGTGSRLCLLYAQAFGACRPKDIHRRGQKELLNAKAEMLEATVPPATPSGHDDTVRHNAAHCANMMLFQAYGDAVGRTVRRLHHPILKQPEEHPVIRSTTKFAASVFAGLALLGTVSELAYADTGSSEVVTEVKPAEKPSIADSLSANKIPDSNRNAKDLRAYIHNRLDDKHLLELYEKAEAETGLDWRVIATIHYRETGGSLYYPGNGQGLFQDYANRGKYPRSGKASDSEFIDQSKWLAKFMKGKVGISNVDLFDPDSSAFDPEKLYRAFFNYNGTPQFYRDQADRIFGKGAPGYLGSPYVMSRMYAQTDGRKNPRFRQFTGDASARLQPATNQIGAMPFFLGLLQATGKYNPAKTYSTYTGHNYPIWIRNPKGSNPSHGGQTGGSQGGEQSPNSGATKPSSTVRDLAYYYQYDPRYKDSGFNPISLVTGQSVNRGNTVASSACGLLSAQMVIAMADKHDSINIVKKTNLYQHEHWRYMDASGNTGLKLGGIVEDINDSTEDAQAKTVEFPVGDANEAAALLRGLSEGKVYIVAGRDTSGSTPFTKGGHYIVITGIDENDPSRVMVLDSLSPDKSKKSWSALDIAKHMNRSLAETTFKGNNTSVQDPTDTVTQPTAPDSGATQPPVDNSNESQAPVESTPGTVDTPASPTENPMDLPESGTLPVTNQPFNPNEATSAEIVQTNPVTTGTQTETGGVVPDNQTLNVPETLPQGTAPESVAPMDVPTLADVPVTQQNVIAPEAAISTEAIAQVIAQATPAQVVQLDTGTVVVPIAPQISSVKLMDVPAAKYKDGQEVRDITTLTKPRDVAKFIIEEATTAYLVQPGDTGQHTTRPDSKVPGTPQRNGGSEERGGTAAGKKIEDKPSEEKIPETNGDNGKTIKAPKQAKVKVITTSISRAQVTDSPKENVYAHYNGPITEKGYAVPFSLHKYASTDISCFYDGYHTISGTHTGIDFAIPVGTPLVAIRGGIVRIASNGTLKVEAPDGTAWNYQHMNNIKVKVGDHIVTGQPVGRSGNRNTQGAHLHLTIQTKASGAGREMPSRRQGKRVVYRKTDDGFRDAYILSPKQVADWLDQTGK